MAAGLAPFHAQRGPAARPVPRFFRQCELVYVVADERDVIRVRTNYRKSDRLRIIATVQDPNA